MNHARIIHLADVITIIVTASLYLFPLAVLRVCIDLGWHA